MTVELIKEQRDWIGLSSDTKPTGAPIGSTFFEYDTLITYVSYDGTNWTPYHNGVLTI